jgi:uncharacterized protein YdiU (UPF0061 family)
MKSIPEKNNSKLIQLLSKQNNSWTLSLNCDLESDTHDPNNTSRPVKSGHYVYVRPTPLPNPYLVSYSRNMAEILGLDHKTCTSQDFISIFSGNIKNCSWATPYALSIYGKEMYDNCPFKNDTGYGDGRCVSLMEVVVGKPSIRWELQLKGAGKTPFCRGGDGRAVLRSCVREFIASEAMANLGVSTTRALCVTASGTEKIYRPWFSDNIKNNQSQSNTKNPDIMQESITAMLCRVSTSFIRVGHLELFSRRVRNAKTEREKDFRMKELELVVEHAIFREYPSINKLKDNNGNILPLQKRILMMLELAAKRFAKLCADWLRVGYVQGNFHSDNCLVGGKTMDYGPFSFMEKYDPNWNVWTGAGQEYSFINQPIAGGKNFETLVNACIPLLDSCHENLANKINDKYYEISTNIINKMWARKLGFAEFSPLVNEIKTKLFKLLELSFVDYTIFWRQLSEIIEKFGNYNVAQKIDYPKIFSLLDDSFYTVINMTIWIEWIEWLEYWFISVRKSVLGNDNIYSHNNSTNNSTKNIAREMKRVSPKFIPREWMLVSAYELANKGDFSLVNELQLLFEAPYAEHDIDTVEKYYKKAPLNSYNGNGIAGTTFMTCSS